MQIDGHEYSKNNSSSIDIAQILEGYEEDISSKECFRDETIRQYFKLFAYLSLFLTSFWCLNGLVNTFLSDDTPVLGCRGICAEAEKRPDVRMLEVICNHGKETIKFFFISAGLSLGCFSLTVIHSYIIVPRISTYAYVFFIHIFIFISLASCSVATMAEGMSSLRQYRADAERFLRIPSNQSEDVFRYLGISICALLIFLCFGLLLWLIFDQIRHNHEVTKLEKLIDELELDGQNRISNIMTDVTSPAKGFELLSPLSSNSLKLKNDESPLLLPHNAFNNSNSSPGSSKNAKVSLYSPPSMKEVDIQHTVFDQQSTLSESKPLISSLSYKQRADIKNDLFVSSLKKPKVNQPQINDGEIDNYVKKQIQGQNMNSSVVNDDAPGKKNITGDKDLNGSSTTNNLNSAATAINKMQQLLSAKKSSNDKSSSLDNKKLTHKHNYVSRKLDSEINVNPSNNNDSSSLLEPILSSAIELKDDSELRQKQQNDIPSIVSDDLLAVGKNMVDNTLQDPITKETNSKKMKIKKERKSEKGELNLDEEMEFGGGTLKPNDVISTNVDETKNKQKKSKKYSSKKKASADE